MVGMFGGLRMSDFRSFRDRHSLGAHAVARDTAGGFGGRGIFTRCVKTVLPKNLLHSKQCTTSTDWLPTTSRRKIPWQNGRLSRAAVSSPIRRWARRCGRGGRVDMLPDPIHQILRSATAVPAVVGSPADREGEVRS